MDWTQADLGQQVGASAAMIRKIEADERRPSHELAVLLADHLAVSEAEREIFIRSARNITAIESLPPQDEPPTIPRPIDNPPNNLPAPMTSMVNRVNDLAAVTDLILKDEARLVTLLGPPGMGKTRLSIQVAENTLAYFPGGVWFVDLSTISDATLVVPAMALALGLSLGPGRTPGEQLEIELGDRKVLFILDNFEQVADRAALGVAMLLRSCKGLKVLVTSRIRLDVYGEYEYPLPPMTMPPPARQYEPDEILGYEAAQLFLARIRQHSPTFELTSSSMAAVAEICRRMEGLPLALELAAARTRRLSVEELSVALREASGSDWHSLLHSTARDLPPRQQTLFNAITWSYSLLPLELQALLRQLSVFSGSFDFPAVAAVIDTPKLMNEAMLRDALDRLVDHNLVSEVSHSPDRWRLLEMIREFSLGELDERERHVATKNHLRHYATRQTDWHAEWLDPSYLAAIEDDLENYRAALHHSFETNDTSLALQLSATMGRFWERHGLLDEGRAILTKVLAMSGESDPKARFVVMHEATILAWMQHDFETAESLAMNALAWARAQQIPQAVVVVFNMLGRIYIEQERYDEADQVLTEGIEMGNRLTPPSNSGMLFVQRGEVALAQGALKQAEALTRAGLGTVAESDLIPYCLGWNNLAEVSLARGDTLSALEALRHVLPLAHLHSRRARIFLNAVAGLRLAELTSPVEDTVDALCLLSYVTASNDRLGDPLSPMTRKLLTSRIDQASVCLSSGLWRAARDKGRRMTLAEALTLARTFFSAELLKPAESASPAPE